MESLLHSLRVYVVISLYLLLNLMLIESLLLSLRVYVVISLCYRTSC